MASGNELALKLVASQIEFVQEVCMGSANHMQGECAEKATEINGGNPLVLPESIPKGSGQGEKQ